MDINRLTAEAIALHGVKLDADDPAMVIVTMNRLMLEQAVREVADEIKQVAKEFEAAGERVQKGVGTAVAREVARAGRGSLLISTDVSWKLAAFAVIIFVLGCLAGKFL